MPPESEYRSAGKQALLTWALTHVSTTQSVEACHSLVSLRDPVPGLCPRSSYCAQTAPARAICCKFDYVLAAMPVASFAVLAALLFRVSFHGLVWKKI